MPAACCIATTLAVSLFIEDATELRPIARDPVRQALADDRISADELIQRIENDLKITTVQARKYANAVVLRGTVPKREQLRQIAKLAEKCDAKVIWQIDVTDASDRIVLEARLMELQSDLRLVALPGLVAELPQCAEAARFGVVENLDDFLKTVRRRRGEKGSIETVSKPKLRMYNGGESTFSVGESLKPGDDQFVGTSVNVSARVMANDVRLDLQIEDKRASNATEGAKVAEAPVEIRTTTFEVDASVLHGEALIVAWPIARAEKQALKDLESLSEYGMLILRPLPAERPEAVPEGFPDFTKSDTPLNILGTRF